MICVLHENNSFVTWLVQCRYLLFLYVFCNYVVYVFHVGCEISLFLIIGFSFYFISHSAVYVLFFVL